MISSQAKTVLIVQAIQIAAVVIAVVMSPLSAGAKALSIVSAVFFMGIGAWLTVYAVNCMIYGSCDVFAWVIVGIMLFFFVLAVLSSFLGASVMKKYNSDFNGMLSSGIKKVTPTQFGVAPTKGPEPEHKDERKHEGPHKPVAHPPHHAPPTPKPAHKEPFASPEDSVFEQFACHR